MYLIRLRRDNTRLSEEQANLLKAQVKKLRICPPIVEEVGVYGYTSSALAEATQKAMIDSHPGWIFALAEPLYKGFEGYKACIIAFQMSPKAFEATFPNYVVVQE